MLLWFSAYAYSSFSSKLDSLTSRLWLEKEERDRRLVFVAEDVSVEEEDLKLSCQLKKMSIYFLGDSHYGVRGIKFSNFYVKPSE